MAERVEYAKLENNRIVYIPDVIVVGGVTYVKYDGTFPEAIANAAGYYRVVDTPRPVDEHSYTFHWEQRENIIVKVWDQLPDPPAPPEPTPEEKREEAYETWQIIEWPIETETTDEGVFQAKPSVSQSWANSSSTDGSTYKNEVPNGLITVDQGVKLATEYGCETTTRAAVFVTYLKNEITNAKEKIRELYPDANE